MASHLLQHLGQATEVAVWKVLRLPQVQDHTSGTGFGGKVVQIPECDKAVVMNSLKLLTSVLSSIFVQVSSRKTAH